MKAIHFALILSLSAFSVTVSSMQLGTMSLAGSGCFGSTKLVPISGSEGRYAFPIRARLNKKADTALERKACNMRIPITLAANEKIQLVNLSQVVRVVGYKGVEVKSSLSMGIVGRGSSPLNYEFKANEDDTSVVEILKVDGLIAESECGKNSMLTGNLNLIANGSAAAFVSTGTAVLTLKVLECN